MKGIYASGPKEFSLREMEEPTLGKDDVLIAIRMAGICGSDVHTLRGRNPFVNYPTIPGHECMGEVLKAPKKSGLQKGDRVTVFPEVGCGKCAACREGRVIHCPDFKFVGVHLPGGCFCEKVAVPYQRVFQLPKRMEDEVGAMVEPTAVGVHAAQRGGVKKGCKVVVIGGGTIGLLTAQAARAFGASRVVISEPLAERREIAHSLGFRLLCNPLEEDLVSFVQRHLKLADIVFDIVGTPQTLQESQTFLRPNGTLVLVALPHIAGLGVIYQPIFAKELKVVGSRTYFKSDFPLAIRLLQSKKIRVKPIISGIFSLERFVEGLENLEREPQKYIKVLIRPGLEE